MNSLSAEEIIETYGIRPLVITLYPISEGYQLTIPGRNCADCHVQKFSYEDPSLLECVERAEIPFFIADLLEGWSLAKLFFNGCLLVELRDRRNLVDLHQPVCPMRHIVLQPSNQSISTDVNSALTQWELEWGQPASLCEALELESCLIALNAGPLDLQTPMSVSREFHCEETDEILQSRKICRLAKKRRAAGVAVDRHLKLSRLVGNSSNLAISNVKKEEVEDNWDRHSGDSPPLMDKYDPNDPSLTSYYDPIEIAQMRHAKAADSPVFLEDNFRLVEEFFIEADIKPVQTDMAVTLSSHTRLRLKQNLTDRLYSCDLIVTSADQSGTMSESVSLGYFIGTDRDMKLYVGQFFEMITEEGRKPMKISRAAPGQSPVLLSPAETAKLQDCLNCC